MTRRALPKPVEAWGVYDKDGNLDIVQHNEEWARSFCVGGRTLHRVRIVPVTKTRKTKKPAKGRSKK